MAEFALSRYRLRLDWRKPRHRLAMAGKDNFFAAARRFNEFGELGLGFGDIDLTQHGSNIAN